MIPESFNRHGKIAFQFSGGKDSTAALYFLRPYWHYMTVYWLNTGKAVPEVESHVRRVAAELPYFIEVYEPGLRDKVWANGWPTDLLPVDYSAFGLMVRRADSPPLQTRYDCCGQALMQPLHRRMLADHITLIVRGQKLSDKGKGPYNNGDSVDGIEFFYPIEGWTDQQVFAYLDELGIALPESYQYIEASPDCLDCTAWWGEGRSRFLEARYPNEHASYKVVLRYIRATVAQQLSELDREVM